jgi:HlyD family type I secretion membrane fusion protein
VIREKINQLESQIDGAAAQATAYAAQSRSVHAEAANVAPLVDKGILARPRLLELQRSGYGLDGQIADARANMAKYRQAIAEQALEIAQLGKDQMAEVTKDLRDVHARLVEVLPKRTNAAAVLSRMEIRSPYAGTVVGLSVFSIGAVIQHGEKILDIVPDADALTLEARVAVEDISEVHPGMRAEVRLTAYQQRIVPTVPGEVVQVSADRLADPKTGEPYFVATVRPDRAALAALPGVQLYPGMPATVTMPTVSRTALDYLLGPLAMSFNKAFRQK